MQAKSIDFLDQIPLQKMPADLWLRFAWSLCVDKDCAKTSEIISIQDGVWSVACHSAHAVRVLSQPQVIIDQLIKMSLKRPLPRIEKIIPIMTRIENEQDTQSLEPEIKDDARIPVTIDDPTMRRVLSRFLIKMDRG